MCMENYVYASCQKHIVSTFNRCLRSIYYRYSIYQSMLPILYRNFQYIMEYFLDTQYVRFNKSSQQILTIYTIFQRTSDPFYIVCYYIKQVTTSWTGGMLNPLFYLFGSGVWLQVIVVLLLQLLGQGVQAGLLNHIGAKTAGGFQQGLSVCILVFLKSGNA